MNSRIDILRRCGRAGAGLLIGLGLIHEGAAFWVYPSFAGHLSRGEAHAFLVMFLATGAATFGCGLLLWRAFRAIEKGEAWAVSIGLGAALFALLLGLGSMLAMPDNPFAYLATFAAILVLVPRRLACAVGQREVSHD